MGKKVTAKRPSGVFAGRLREAREHKGWSQQDLCDRLAEVGARTDRATIARTESGERGVSLDDAVLYSAALGASLVHMIIPINGGELLALAPQWEVTPRLARHWVRAESALRPEDGRTLVAEAPEEEWLARQHVFLDLAAAQLRDVVDAVVDEDRERAADSIDKLNLLLERIRKEVDDGPR